MKPFAWTPADAKPITASPGDDAAAVDHLRARHDPDAGAGEVELAGGVDAGELGRLSADERDPCPPAHLGRSLDEVGDLVELDLVGRDVVEQQERRGAAREHVVDAVRGQIGAAVAQPPAGAREHELRADAVRRGGEQPLVVERMQPGERPEPGRSRRLHGFAQPFDDGAGSCQRDPRCGVAVLRGQSGSVRRRAAGPT